ncbi:MAG: hypothetical protein COU07_02630 [Candidatus Harrisonbacteria bacterium CG10_big_fil_rev_8_21_14_0_10_40_38]|uniref:Uncharacterized protein n=1 Tax=Candidatus Harrisonbacteria bacterium CG10_big_fil_rev_8_21_14_0_10_40_38 TaxID=1974583 RepID=A0A2H0URQ8_9BACT|nr:MAG: hypothetical protein COU07_02630 [Candidatus Harrisonbacteria bacterium CG10_big_fil_rev_8_21_14_0_10_40_38]
MPYENLAFYISTGILLFALFIQSKEKTKKFIKPLFWTTSVLVLGYLSYITYLQYKAFQKSYLDLTIGTLDGLKWFAGYVQLHFWNTYLVSFVAALLIFALAKYINKKRGEVFLEGEEIYLGGLGVLLVGYPSFFFYIPLVLLLAIITSLITKKQKERLPLYYFWMPTAILVLLVIFFWAEHQSWWFTFRF